MDVLHHGPDNGQTTRFRRESVNLISTLSDEASETFNGIGAANRAMPDQREGIKGQYMLFIFDQAASGFWVALALFGFEARQIEECILFLLLLPDPCQFASDLLLLTMRNRVHHLALLVY